MGRSGTSELLNASPTHETKRRRAVALRRGVGARDAAPFAVLLEVEVNGHRRAEPRREALGARVDGLATCAAQRRGARSREVRDLRRPRQLFFHGARHHRCFRHLRHRHGDSRRWCDAWRRRRGHDDGLQRRRDLDRRLRLDALEEIRGHRCGHEQHHRQRRDGDARAHQSWGLYAASSGNGAPRSTRTVMGISSANVTTMPAPASNRLTRPAHASSGHNATMPPTATTVAR